MFVFITIALAGLAVYPVEAVGFSNSSTSRSSASKSSETITTTKFSSIPVNSSSSSSTSTIYADPNCDPTLENCDVPGTPLWNIYEFENPYLLDGTKNDSEIAANPSLQQLCSNSWMSLFSQYKSTASWTSETTTYTWTATTRVETINNYRQHTTRTVTDDALTATGTRIEYPIASSLPMSSPCCFDCSLYGGNIEVYFWPTQTTSSFAKTLVNPDGYTFIYPSIYVSFETLYAWDYCTTIGSGYVNKTVGFDPGELSTAPHAWSFGVYHSQAPRLDTIWTAAKFGEVTDCAEDLTTILSTVIDESHTPTLTLTYNPCSPQLSVPTKLYSLDPRWQSCRPAIKGFWDPPYSLTPGPSLSTLSAADDNQPPPFVPQFKSIGGNGNGDPAAGATPSPNTASKTSYTKSTPTIADDPPANGPPANDPPPADPSPKNTPSDTPAHAPDPVIILGSSTITGNSDSVFVVGTVSMSPGGDPVTIAGAAYSLTSDGSNILVITSKLTPGPQSSPIITLGGAIITGDSASVFKFGTASLSPGGTPIIISGTTYSLATNGNEIVILTAPFSSPPTPEVLVIGSQTLTAGDSAITISGTVLSLEAGGKTVVIGGVTQDLSSWMQVISTATSSGGIASIIAGMGGFATPTPDPTSVTGNESEGYNGDPFLGDGPREFEAHVWITALALIFGVGAIWVL